MPRQADPAERRRHRRVTSSVPFKLLAEGKEEPFEVVSVRVQAA